MVNVTQLYDSPGLLMGDDGLGMRYAAAAGGAGAAGAGMMYGGYDDQWEVRRYCDNLQAT